MMKEEPGSAKRTPGTLEGIQWAPKVRLEKIRRLYETDAKGIVDEDLINDVGYAIYARCETIWIVTERRCPRCTERLEGEPARESVLRCRGCGWAVRWRSYQRSYKRRRIHGGRAYGSFLDFMREFRAAKGPREKLIAIDKVIHAVHESLNKVWTTPASVNLMDGGREDVLALLDALAYSDVSTPGTTDRKAAWRRKIAEGDAATEAHYARKDGVRPTAAEQGSGGEV